MGNQTCGFALYSCGKKFMQKGIMVSFWLLSLLLLIPMYLFCSSVVGLSIVWLHDCLQKWGEENENRNLWNHVSKQVEMLWKFRSQGSLLWAIFWRLWYLVERSHGCCSSQWMMRTVLGLSKNISVLTFKMCIRLEVSELWGKEH